MTEIVRDAINEEAIALLASDPQAYFDQHPRRTPIFDTVRACNYNEVKAMARLDAADFHLHVQDALALFGKPVTEPTPDDEALADEMEEADEAEAEAEKVIDEQRKSWQAWALALIFALLAVYAGCAWMVHA